MSTRTIETPIGALTLTASADAVTAVRFGADGSLTGYAGGLETKRRLLALEGITHLK